MRALLPCVIAVLPLSLAVGCGAKVTVDLAGATGSGGAGTTGSSGVGAAGTGGVGASSTTSTTVSTGTEPSNVCGGLAGTPCPSNQFCKFDPVDACGGGDSTGVCQPRPTVCSTDCPGVCGCDGQFYCNSCNAAAAGVDVENNNACSSVDAGPPPPPSDDYVAWALPTNLPRFVISKIEPTMDLCVVLVLAQHGGPSAGLVVPMGWSVEQAWVHEGAADCMSMIGTVPVPTGQTAKSTGGGGTITYPTGVGIPCFVSIDATQTFLPGAPWVPPMDLLSASNIPVQGVACGG